MREMRKNRELKKENWNKSSASINEVLMRSNNHPAFSIYA
jgi:hypothetical protein